MSTSVKELVRRYREELWNEGNLKVADEIIAADCRYHIYDPITTLLGNRTRACHEGCTSVSHSLPGSPHHHRRSVCRRRPGHGALDFSRHTHRRVVRSSSEPNENHDRRNGYVSRCGREDSGVLGELGHDGLHAADRLGTCSRQRVGIGVRPTGKFNVGRPLRAAATPSKSSLLPFRYRRPNTTCLHCHRRSAESGRQQAGASQLESESGSKLLHWQGTAMEYGGVGQCPPWPLSKTVVRQSAA